MNYVLSPDLRVAVQNLVERMMEIGSKKIESFRFDLVHDYEYLRAEGPGVYHWVVRRYGTHIGQTAIEAAKTTEAEQYDYYILIVDRVEEPPMTGVPATIYGDAFRVERRVFVGKEEV